MIENVYSPRLRMEYDSNNKNIINIILRNTNEIIGYILEIYDNNELIIVVVCR